MTVLDYNLGYGGYTLNPAQLTLLTNDLNTALLASNPAQLGLGVNIYTDLLSFLAPGGERLAGVDPDVVTWLQGAVTINPNTTAEGTIIREYTKDFYQIRYGITPTDDQINEASNSIAITLAQDIVTNGGAIPNIVGLGTADAGGMASHLFTQFSEPGVYSPWAGTIFFCFSRYRSVLPEMVTRYGYGYRHSSQSRRRCETICNL